MFSQERHEDVLDMCLVQFEPDSAEFIKVGRQRKESIIEYGLEAYKFHVKGIVRHPVQLGSRPCLSLSRFMK